MCGICGIVSTTLSKEQKESFTQLMLQKLTHRGPNGSWIQSKSEATFGAARLAIRGINGRQPFTDDKTGVMVICNGEIDNHKDLRYWLQKKGRIVKSDTDIAILPDLYLELGEDYVKELVGAFSIAIWDPRKKRVIFSRDRAGERPLFFQQQHSNIIFASELSALVTVLGEEVEINKISIKNYLQLGHFPAPTTPFTKIEKIGPSEQIVIDLAKTHKYKYWVWTQTDTNKVEVSINTFDPIFREAVKKQSDVDVPIGIFLSGGVDSALIAATAHSIQPKKKFKAYSLRFMESSFDESPYAERIARKFHMDYTPIYVQAHEIPPLLKKIIQTTGEPLADPAWIPTALLCSRAKEEVSLAFSGEGADELFGGYPTYFGAMLAKKYTTLPSWIRSIICKAIESWPTTDQKVTLSYLLKSFVQADTLDDMSRHILWTSCINPKIMQSIGLEPASFDWLVESPLLDKLQLYDFERNLGEGLLTKTDRASMCASLEIRSPYLDQAVIEFAGKLSPQQRICRINTKVFLKQYAIQYLPKDIVYRRKRGLSIPFNSWLRGPLKDWAESLLRNQELQILGIDMKGCITLFENHLLRKADHSKALWALIVMSEWLTWWKAQQTQSKV